MEISELLHQWLSARLNDDERNWLDGQLANIADVESDRAVFLPVSLAARKISGEHLNLSDTEIADAQRIRAHCSPSSWTLSQTARTLLMLRSTDDPQTLHDRLETLFRSADVDELVALYAALPIYPEPGLYVERAVEGLRTNMKNVFEAVAHNNPFPRENFTEGAWNQMVLKALFVESDLYPILGLDERANPELARMLRDYAHERWSAGRSVSPELWRCVGPYADDAAVTDLERVLKKGDARERRAALFALGSCSNTRAQDLITRSDTSVDTTLPARDADWKALMNSRVVH